MSETPTFDTAALFDAECYLRFYEPMLDDQRSEREVERLLEWLQLPADGAVLDLACGHGRHANRLAARGYAVTGLDITAAFLERARTEAVASGLVVDYRHGDQRDLADEVAFDGAFCVYSAFGYFDDAGNRQVIENVARALRPGGRFVLDTMPRDGLLRNWQPCSVQERDGDLMIDRHRFESATGRIIVKRHYLVGARRVDAEYFVRVYTPQELCALFAACGLRVLASYGDWEGGPLRHDGGRLIVVGERPPEAES